MREENTVVEERQQEENLPVAEVLGEQPQDTNAPSLPEPENPSQHETADETTEPAHPEESAEEAAEQTQLVEPSEEVIAEEVAKSAKTSSSLGSSEIPYHERFYLKYREGKRNVPLDLDGTKAFLQEMGFDGGELRQAREGKNRAESIRNSEKNKNNQMYCSYCGAEIAGVEFFRLPDGRMRCTTCSSTVVQSKAEMEELCRRVIANMDNFFGATIDVPVSIEVIDQRKLKKKIGVPLGTKDSQSLLILGVAINNKRKKTYSIILENGAPRISLIATFAHELTHIWQYTHWDKNKNFKQCPKSKRLLVYEGMAKWAEIQYLYLIGETNVAKREEYITRNRRDEYGIGFCLYEDQYPLSRTAMSCEDTPFTSNQYPL